MNTLVRTEDTLEVLEKALVENHGDLKQASISCGLGDLLGRIVMWIEDDPEVKERIKQAQLIGWSTLESEATRRAVKGVEEAVYYQGEVVGYKTVYSDGLLAQMLKARVPGYKDDGGATKAIVQVNIVPRANSYEEWVTMREQTLALKQVKEINRDKSIEFLGKLMTQPSVEDNGLGDLGI